MVGVQEIRKIVVMTKSKRYGIIFFCLCIVVAITSIAYKAWLSSLSQTYVIGKITKVAKSPTGGHHMNYSYMVAGKAYKATMDFDNSYKDVRINNQYLVSVPDDHEHHGVMM